MCVHIRKRSSNSLLSHIRRGRGYRRRIRSQIHPPSIIKQANIQLRLLSSHLPGTQTSIGQCQNGPAFTTTCISIPITGKGSHYQTLTTRQDVPTSTRGKTSGIPAPLGDIHHHPSPYTTHCLHRHCCGYTFRYAWQNRCDERLLH